LFQDTTQATTSPTHHAGGLGSVPVRPAKQLPKSSSQQKQSRKTVGSQVGSKSFLFAVIVGLLEIL